MSLQELLSNDVDGHRPKKHRSNQHASREDDLEVTGQKLIKGLFSNPNWKPFKTVTVEEVVIDVDDVKLQGLKMAWGEGPYNSVVSALMERKEYNTNGTGRAVDFWNYKEGRKATTRECIEHILGALRNSNSSV